MLSSGQKPGLLGTCACSLNQVLAAAAEAPLVVVEGHVVHLDAELVRRAGVLISGRFWFAAYPSEFPVFLCSLTNDILFFWDFSKLR